MTAATPAGSRTDGPVMVMLALPRPLSVLVVDGDPDAAGSLAEVLAACGCESRVAADAEAAARSAAASPPDVVVTDLRLPAADAWDLAATLSRRPGPRPILVALTGSARVADRERCRAAGFDHYLLKGSDPAALVAVLGSYTGGPSAG